MQYFTIFQDELHSFNIQDDQSWAFRETVQKISKITDTARQFLLLISAKFAVNINRLTECVYTKITYAVISHPSV